MSDVVAQVPRASARPSRPRPAWDRLWTMALAHFTNDLYAAFLAPLLPLVVAKFGLSLALAGLMGTAFNATAALTQPLFGLAADRVRRPAFAVLGPTVTVLGMGLVGLAPTYGLMLLILFLTGLGVASFHPQAFALAGEIGGAQRGTALSVFVAGGELGYALGPLFVAPIVGALGLHGTVAAAVPGLAACAVLWSRTRTWQGTLPPAPDRLASDLRRHGPLLALVWLIVVIRSVIILSFLLFLPLLLRQRGQSLLAGATAVFLFGGIGALGGLLGGALSDRLGRRAILALSFVLGTPLLVLFTFTTSPWGLVALALGGASFYLSAPVNVAIAQEVLPRRASLASAMVTGMAWGMAGISLTAVGALADRIGLAHTLGVVLALSAAGLGAVWALPRRRPADDAPARPASLR
jgi:FSR family fosmidomycin resistance protein-like MFS transporter